MPQLIHPCPFGPLMISVENVTMDKNTVALLPLGVYKLTVRFRNKTGGIVFDYSIVFEIL